MDVLLHPSLLEAYRFLGAASVVLFATVIFYKLVKKQDSKKEV